MVTNSHTGLSERSVVKRLNQGIYANVTSGVIAAVIFVIIALATGWAAGKAVLGALILGIATFAVAFVITQTITWAKRRGTRPRQESR